VARSTMSAMLQCAESVLSACGPQSALRARLAPFVHDTGNALAALASNADTTRAAYVELACYFGESADALPSSETFFDVVVRFVAQYNAAVKRLDASRPRVASAITTRQMSRTTVQTSSSGGKKAAIVIVDEPLAAVDRDDVVDDDYTIAPVSKENGPAMSSPSPRKRGRLDFNHLDDALPVLSDTPQKPRSMALDVDDKVDTPAKRRKNARE